MGSWVGFISRCEMHGGHAGPQPHELYAKYTWKIENFKDVQKRELRSTVFRVGDFKW